MPAPPDIVLHKPRENNRVFAAAVSRTDRTRHIVRVADARIVDVDHTSLTTRVLAPDGAWVEAVEAIDREVASRLRGWTKEHGIQEGSLRRSVCPAGGSALFTLRNQPDSGAHGVLTVLDITAELLDIKRSKKDDKYRLVWRILESQFKERVGDEAVDGWDEEEAGGEEEAGDGSASEGGPPSADGEAEEPRGDSVEVAPRGGGQEEDASLRDITAELRGIAERLSVLQNR